MPNKKATQKTARLNVRKLRKGAGLTLKDLQRQTGINYSTLIDHEAGRAIRVDFLTLAKLKRALSCSWDELLRLQG